MNQTRISQLQAWLTEQDIDAALVSLSENIILLCQDYWPRNGLAFCYVPKQGEAALLLPKPELEDLPAEFSGAVHAFGYVDLNEGNAYDNVAAILKTLSAGCTVRRVALELSAQSVAPALCDGEIILPGALTRGVVSAVWPDAALVDLLPATLAMRAIKNEGDIARIERVNRLAYAGIAEFCKVLERGADCTERSLAVLVESYIALHAADVGARYARAWAQVTSGPRTVGAWNAGMVTTDRSVQDGEPVMIEMGTAADGYFCDLTMTCCKGQAKGQIAEILETVRGAQAAALAAVRPGVRARDIDAAARSYIEQAGYGKYFNHGTGHGTGFAYHDGAPALNPASEDVLQAGMIHSVEPGIYVPGVGGVRLELNALVTEQGARVLGK